MILKTYKIPWDIFYLHQIVKKKFPFLYNFIEGF